mmetsp:Transcript_63495/g.112936  ORF Transcript_63495/g.112936 Transcript_63495/m.112936 type:complete len:876 (-) Transcript_63495:118-2745(-)
MAVPDLTSSGPDGMAMTTPRMMKLEPVTRPSMARPCSPNPMRPVPAAKSVIPSREEQARYRQTSPTRSTSQYQAVASNPSPPVTGNGQGYVVVGSHRQSPAAVAPRQFASSPQLAAVAVAATAQRPYMQPVISAASAAVPASTACAVPGSPRAASPAPPRFGSREAQYEIPFGSPQSQNRQVGMVQNSWVQGPVLVSPRYPSPSAACQVMSSSSHVDYTRRALSPGQRASSSPMSPATPWTAGPPRRDRAVVDQVGEDSLAKQLKALQKAKSQAAAQLAQSEQAIALRQDQLRRETYKALYASGLAEALKRWPSPEPAPYRTVNPPMEVVTEPPPVIPEPQSFMAEEPSPGGLEEPYVPPEAPYVPPEAEGPGLSSAEGNSEAQLEDAELNAMVEEFRPGPASLSSRGDESNITLGTNQRDGEQKSAEDQELPGESASIPPDADDVGAMAQQSIQVEPVEYEQVPLPAQERVVPRPSNTDQDVSATARKNLGQKDVPASSTRASSPPRSGPRTSTGGSQAAWSHDGKASPGAPAKPPRPGSVRPTSPLSKSGRRASAPPPAVLPPHVMQEELDRCLEALSAVDMPVSSLRELRVLKKPPAGVQKILEAIGLLLGEKDQKPATVRKLLSDNLPLRLESVDPASITSAQGSQLLKLLADDAVKQEAISRTCQRAMPLALWCECIAIYLSRTHPSWGAGKQSESVASRDYPGMDGSQDGLDRPSEIPPQADIPPEKPATNGSHIQDNLVITPDLSKLSPAELRAVSELRVTKPEVGSVVFHGSTDCSNLDVHQNVVLKRGYVLVYPDPRQKPPVGQGLNKRATVTMYQCFPPGERVSDEEAIEDYKNKIRKMTEENSACRFLDYDCQTGVWQFEVERF